jgi:apolipoprotein D and lipocalin family protein
MKRIEAVLLCGLIGAGAGLVIAGSEPPLETVHNVNLARYAGRWYEIARYPNRFERK